MATRIDSVVQAGYAEPVIIDEGALSAVVSMLEISNVERGGQARDRIFQCVEDLATRRAHTVRAERTARDRADLKELATVTESRQLSERVGLALDQLESLREDNPVLFRRLEGVVGGAALHEWLKQLAAADHFLAGFGQEIERAASSLRDEFQSENRRGQPPKHRERAFASSLYRIWIEFTDRGTSRQNAYGRVKDPFGDFVDAAGKLIDSDFNGHDHARQIHEAARDFASESDSGGE
jgi:hypothetical protein